MRPSQLNPAYFARWVQLNPSILGTVDRSLAVATFPLDWGVQPIATMAALLYGMSQDGTSSVVYPDDWPVPSPSSINHGDQTARFEWWRTNILANVGLTVSQAVLRGAKIVFLWNLETHQPQANIGDVVIDPVTGTQYTVDANSIFANYTINSATWRNALVGDLSQAYTTMPVWAYVSPHSSGGLNVLQEVFKTVTDAGLEVGITARAKIYAYNNGFQPTQTEATGPDPNAIYTGGAIPQNVQILLDKVAYGRTNFGIKRYYIDEGDALFLQYHPSFAKIIKRTFPDVTIYPEKHTDDTYSWAVPYIPLDEPGDQALGTTQYIRDIYPNAAELIYLGNAGQGNDVSTTQTQIALTPSVRNGDILLAYEPDTSPLSNGYYAQQIYLAAAISTGGNVSWYAGGWGSPVTTTVITVPAPDLRGPGADQVTMTWKSLTTDQPIVGGDVWVTSDLAGTDVIAGTLETDSNGQALFLLNDGSQYYFWARKAGENSIEHQLFTASKDVD